MIIIVEGYCTESETWIGQEFGSGQKADALKLMETIKGDKSISYVPKGNDYSFTPTHKLPIDQYFGMMKDWANE